MVRSPPTVSTKTRSLNRNVGMYAHAEPVATHACPFKLVLGRQQVFVIRAIVQVFEGLARDQPLKGFDVVFAGADLEDHIEVGPDDSKV